MSVNFLITDHAVQQFISRYDRTLSYAEGDRLLNEVCKKERVQRLPEKTNHGETQWHVPYLGLVLITKPRKEGNIVVTVVSEDHVKGIQRQIDVSLHYQEVLAAEDPEGVPLVVQPLRPAKHNHARFVVDVEYLDSYPNRDYTIDLIRARMDKMLRNGLQIKRGSVKGVIVSKA